MTGPRLGMTGRMTLLAGAVVLLGVGTAAAQPGGWRSHIHFGPPPNDPFSSPDSANGAFDQGFAPNYGPYPSPHWPTLHEALEQYGLFGRRAWGHTAGPSPAYAITPDPAGDLLPPPRLAEPVLSPTALLRVFVPADADIWFDGRPTARTGAERLFVTPPLEPGHGYAYEIRARWQHENGPVNRARTVRVYPGDRLTIDFLLKETGKGGE